MRWWVVVVVFSPVGCGGSGAVTPSDGGSQTAEAGPIQTAEGFCASNPQLSGGDLVGDWTIVDACVISTGAPDNCANVSVSLSVSAQGSVTFNSDHTGSIDVTVILVRNSLVAASCASGGNCASLQADLSSSVVTAICAASAADATRCSCQETFSPYLMQGSGSYTLELPNYLHSPSLQLQGGFLVQGNTLRLDGAGFETTEFDLIAQR
jgi:hypothetical protein